jgi:hypothetical protein
MHTVLPENFVKHKFWCQNLCCNRAVSFPVFMVIILEFLVLYVCLYEINILFFFLRINKLESRENGILKKFLIVNVKIFAIQNFEYYRKWKHFFYQWSPLLEEHWFVWSFLTSPFFSDKSILRKKMSVETWWNDTERGKKNHPEWNRCQCHFVLTNITWSGPELISCLCDEIPAVKPPQPCSSFL